MSEVQSLQQAGPYRITSRLGYNGVVGTFLAHNPGAQVDACVVAIPKDRLVDPTVWSGFQHEFGLLGGMPEGRLARAVDLGDEGNVCWAAYEYLTGQHVGGTVQEIGLPPPGSCFTIMADVVDALMSLQKANLYHGLITPASIFVTMEQEVKLLHTGWGKVLLGVHEGARNPAFMSNLPFLAPETVAGKQGDIASDVFSVGSNLFFLLTGQPVHWTGDPRELAQLMQTQEVNMAPVREAVSAEAAGLIEELLELDPLDRPVNLEALKDRLDSFAVELPGGEQTPSAQEHTDYYGQSTVQYVGELQPDHVSPPPREAPASQGPPPPPPGQHQPQPVPPPPLPPEYADHPAGPPPLPPLKHTPTAPAHQGVPGDPSHPSSVHVPRPSRSGDTHRKRFPGAEAFQPPTKDPTPQAEQPIGDGKGKGTGKKILLIVGGVILIFCLAGVGFAVVTKLLGGEKIAVSTPGDKTAQQTPADGSDTGTEPGGTGATPPAGESKYKLTAERLIAVGRYHREHIRQYGVWATKMQELEEHGLTQEEMIDGWGRRIDIRADGYLVSSGADGKWDTNDDIWIEARNLELGGKVPSGMENQ